MKQKQSNKKNEIKIKQTNKNNIGNIVYSQYRQSREATAQKLEFDVEWVTSRFCTLPT